MYGNVFTMLILDDIKFDCNEHEKEVCQKMFHYVNP